MSQLKRRLSFHKQKRKHQSTAPNPLKDDTDERFLLLRLPTELIHLVLSFLDDPQPLINISQTCKQLYKLSQLCWKYVCIKKFNLEENSTDRRVDWREYYFLRGQLAKPNIFMWESVDNVRGERLSARMAHSSAAIKMHLIIDEQHNNHSSNTNNNNNSSTTSIESPISEFGSGQEIGRSTPSELDSLNQNKIALPKNNTLDHQHLPSSTPSPPSPPKFNSLIDSSDEEFNDREDDSPFQQNRSIQQMNISSSSVESIESSNSSNSTTTSSDSSNFEDLSISHSPRSHQIINYDANNTSHEEEEGEENVNSPNPDTSDPLPMNLSDEIMEDNRHSDSNNNKSFVQDINTHTSPKKKRVSKRSMLSFINIYISFFQTHFHFINNSIVLYSPNNGNIISNRRLFLL